MSDMLRGADLAAQKLLMDFINARSRGPIELEHFFEEWMKFHIRDYRNEEFRRDIWKAFMKLLRDVG